MTDIYNLNQGQKEAAKAFLEFLFSDKKAFIISGPAGVGKTYLMRYIIDTTMPQYDETCKIMGMPPIYNEVMMTATTNKAAEQLQQSTMRPTQTIHSFLNLRVMEDYKTGKSKLEKTRNWTVHVGKIIFIDECSMVDTPLFNVINEGTQDCKIVYVGDHNQLAPVFEKLSPIYYENYPFYELTEPMRNAGQPALMDICQQLRTTVETGEFKPIKLVPGVIDYLNDDQMQAELLDKFAEQTYESRILAYTNKRVMEYNQYIRNMRNLPEPLQAGELLVNNSAIVIRKKMLSVEQGVTVLKNNGRQTVDLGLDATGLPISLEVDMLDIRTDLGDTFTNIPFPVDQSHFNSLVNYFKRLKNWSKYYEMKQTYPDLRPRDAATVHKSQGSTYDSVFLDMENISDVTKPDMAARMLYVAFSRARNRVFLYGDLADKYGGLIQP